jgi:hypothetical protein
MPAIPVGWMLLLANLPSSIGFALFGQYYGEGLSLWTDGNPRLFFAGGIAIDSGINVTAGAGCIPYYATWDGVNATIGWKGFVNTGVQQYKSAACTATFAGAAAMRLGSNESAVNSSFSLARIGQGKLSQELINDPLAPFRVFRRRLWAVSGGAPPATNYLLTLRTANKRGNKLGGTLIGKQ